MTESTSSTVTVFDLVKRENDLLESQKNLYMSAVTNVNMRYRELLCHDFGTTLVKNCAWDLADMVVFNCLPDMYISVQQFVDRVMNFSYQMDDGMTNAALRKLLYETQNGKDCVNEIRREVNDRQQLFSEGRASDKYDTKLKKGYRENRKANGMFHDDLTGTEGGAGNVLHADHIQPHEAIQYETRFIRQDKIDELKQFYNSEPNFWLIHASANTSKSDVRVVKDGDKIVFMNGRELKNASQSRELKDITSTATADQMADATIYMWEKNPKSAPGTKTDTLKSKGYLDEDGKVPKEMRDKLVATYEKALKDESVAKLFPHQNSEGQWTSPMVDYKEVAHNAGVKTIASVQQIITGQVIYYVLPPVVYEARQLLKKGKMTVDRFFSEFAKSTQRIAAYVWGNLKNIIGNTLYNTAHKFIKTFFDIMIEIARGVVKRLLKIAKQVIMALVNCARTIADKKSSRAQKADAVTKILASTVTMTVVDVLIEYLQVKVPKLGKFAEPLEIIVTVLSTNLVMLVLQDLDLFDVQYGFLVANIDKIFDEENERFMQQSEELQTKGKQELEAMADKIRESIAQTEETIRQLNLYEDDAQESLDRINRMFHMGIDFNAEWAYFTAAQTV